MEHFCMQCMKICFHDMHLLLNNNTFLLPVNGHTNLSQSDLPTTA